MKVKFTFYLFLIIILSCGSVAGQKNSAVKDTVLISNNPECIVSFPSIGLPFAKVFGEHFAAQPFVACEEYFSKVGIWFYEANDDELLIQILSGGLSGDAIGSASLPPGEKGKRIISFSPEIKLDKGATYYLKVQAGAPGTTMGIVESQGKDIKQKGFTEIGESENGMALELFFLPVQKGDQITDKSQTGEDDKSQEDIDYENHLNYALRQKRDVWGEELISKPEGPTYQNIKDYLRPLMLVGDYVTSSGVYFLNFGWSDDLFGTSHCALHVADGSEIISEHFKNREKSTIFYVGKEGSERFGLDQKRLNEPSLYKGYQPILMVNYHDDKGVSYHHQSFATYIKETDALASFVRLEIDKNESEEEEVLLKIKIGERGLKLENNSLVKDGKTYFLLQAGAEYKEPFLTYKTELNKDPKSIYIVRFNTPDTTDDFIVDETRFFKEKENVSIKTDKLLSRGCIFEVPEKVVMDAQKNLLFQNLLMTYRYSIGSSYHGNWYPFESSESLKYLGEFGFLDHYRENLQMLIPKDFRGENERMMDWGFKLIYAASYYLLTEDKGFIEKNRTYFDKWFEGIILKRNADPYRLLGKSRQGDIHTSRYYTYAVACIWRGLMDMGYVYSQLDYAESEKYIRLANELRGAFLKEYNIAKVEMPDGSIFYPNVLVEDVPSPYNPITSSKLGSYWNLLMQGMTLNSRIIDLRSEEMEKIISYIFLHGGRFLGLTTFNYYPVSVGSFMKDGLPGYKTTGADNVYGSATIDVLTSQDIAEQIVLSFYGKLAHGMTRGTFVAGEGDAFGVYPGEYYRSMYMSPMNTNNALFLKILHEMLIFTYFNQQGNPDELLLTHFTPRAWLEDGKEIRVRNAPTPFGEISFHIKSFIKQSKIELDIRLPSRSNPEKTLCRLRTPREMKIKNVTINGKGYKLFDEETIDLTGLTGKLLIKVRYN
ncbi:MAG: hypothetical protein PHI32_00570 [Dysgonamonadaceae bacterium]|nr:hypothetical protein [Dysgonamonadaceae bacterium]MDD4729774.1 hypothetical protein [Dysgonamonadaceae bacterium]